MLISGIGALAGSAIGGSVSLATTWLTQHSQERAHRFAQAMTRRQHLYGEFIDEASKLFTDALTHQLDDPSKSVRLYALVGNLPLCASPQVILKAEEVMRRIVETYKLPNIDFRSLAEREKNQTDLLRGYSEACREDLNLWIVADRSNFLQGKL